MKAYLRAPMLILLILSFFLSSCAGTIQGAQLPQPELPANAPVVAQEMIVNLKAGTVAYQVGQALMGKPGTQILVNGSKYLFTWTHEGIGTGMFAIDLDSKTFPDVLGIIKQGGMLMNTKTATDVTSTFEANGWKVVTAAEVSVGLRTLLLGVLEKVATTTLTLYMVVPANWDGKSLPWMSTDPG